MPAPSDLAQSLLAQSLLAQSLLAHAPVAAASFDADLVCRYANDRFALVGIPDPAAGDGGSAQRGAPDFLGRWLFSVLDLRADQVRAVRALLDGHTDEAVFEMAVDPAPDAWDGGATGRTWSVRLFRTGAGADRGVGLLAVDVTPQRELVDQLRYSATHDRLTGLLNAAGLVDTLDAMLARSEADGSRWLVVFGDLDGFKAVNDHIGHHAGDRVLQVVGHRLAEAVRGRDRVARAGGDEFVVLMAAAGEWGSTREWASAGRLVARLRWVVQQPIAVDGTRVGVGITMGAVRTRAGDTPADVLQRADSAMRAERRATGLRAGVSRSAGPVGFGTGRPELTRLPSWRGDRAG